VQSRNRSGLCRDGVMVSMLHSCSRCHSAGSPLAAGRSSGETGGRFYRCLVGVIVLLASGCIAPNLPSYRYHDPHDRGGLLGDYRSGASSHGLPCAAETSDCIAGPHHGRGCSDDDFDGDHGAAKPPEIPWPRYHPVPTRPVFSPPALAPNGFSPPAVSLPAGPASFPAGGH
jgi:hypothetical protein